MTEQGYTYPTPERHREGTEFDTETRVDLQLGDKRLLSPEAVRALRLVEDAYVAPAKEKEKTRQEQSANYISSVGANLSVARRDHLKAA